MTAYTIARPINGIPLNGDEYICDCCGRYIVFESEAIALAAMREMLNCFDIDNDGIHVKEIELEGEP
jgi:hypothetical protein